MRRRKTYKDELQLEFNFPEDDLDTDVGSVITHFPSSQPVLELPILSGEAGIEIFEQVDTLLQQIGDAELRNCRKLNAFILRSFYVEGKSVSEISQLLSEGVEDVPCVTRERVRMLVSEMRDELLSMSSTKKFTKGFVLRRDFLERMAEYAGNHIGHVIKDDRWLTCPRLGTIAFLLHKKVVTGDTVIPWIKTEKMLIDENVEKRLFNAHYAGLFYLLQKEVRPMSFGNILRSIPDQKQMKGVGVSECLLRVLLQHDEVFEVVTDDLFQLRAEHLNVTQRIARIILEERDVTPSDLQRIYAERFGETFSSTTAAGKIYPWCVPIGKSKWVYREDGERQHMPADIIRNFCKERVRFTLHDVQEYLESQGINIKETSIRCYILRDCRPMNSNGNMFCLTSEIPESESHLWRSKYIITTRSRNREWKNKMEVKIRSLLESAPMQRMRQKDVLNQCRHILEHEGITFNNFYKMVNALPWLRTMSIDGKNYLELIDVPPQAVRERHFETHYNGQSRYCNST